VSEPIKAELPQRCANLACTNRVGEGQFVIIFTVTLATYGIKPVALLMCGPCEAAVRLDTP
jgi:hypothetical protein